MTKAVSALLLVVLVLTGALGLPPAGADDPRARRDEARRRAAELAAQLDTLKATEEELLAAASVLDDSVLAAAARVDAARQAVAAAETELEEATALAEETRSQISSLQQAVVDRAVSEFIKPHDSELPSISDSADLAANARSHILLDSVTSIDDDTLDSLAAAREDYDLARDRASIAREAAIARRADTETKLAALERAQAEQQRLRAAVSGRQREVLAEIDQQRASESELTRIIREREAAAVSRPTGGRRAGGCIWPTRGRVTSEFGNRWGRQHQGIDIGAGSGTTIWAAKAGTVIFAGQQGGYGNLTIIDHGGGLTTAYAHQSSIGVSNGQQVSQGDPIGRVGNTGRSTGPHLHFETRYSGAAQNPRGCLP